MNNLEMIISFIFVGIVILIMIRNMIRIRKISNVFRKEEILEELSRKDKRINKYV